MIALKLSEVARVVDGRLVGDGDARVSGVTIDTRQVQPGQLFAALKGEFFDGHDFAKDAIAQGACGVLCERDVEASPRIEVESVLGAMATLGGFVRDSVDPLVVGVTGSTGKTSTKDFIHAVLSREMSTVATERSFNNEIGVPLTLLNVDETTEALVCELAAQRQGEIAELCSVVRPQVGVVTNVGEAHMEYFGTQEAIALAKGELPSCLPEGGTAILNADDPRVVAMGSLTAANIITYGLGPGADVRAESVQTDRAGRPRFRLTRGYEHDWVELAVSGRHQVPNALAAACVGMALGIELKVCARSLERARLSRWRMEVIEREGVRWINDAYNANPQSMKAALQSAVEMGGDRLIAVLGYMAELGPISDEAHADVGRRAAQVADKVVVVGKGAEALYEAAAQVGNAETVRVDDVQDAREAIGEVREGDVVLVKASRAVGLEKIVEEL